MVFCSCYKETRKGEAGEFGEPLTAEPASYGGSLSVLLVLVRGGPLGPVGKSGFARGGFMECHETFGHLDNFLLLAAGQFGDLVKNLAEASAG